MRRIARQISNTNLKEPWLETATKQLAGLPCVLLDTVASPVVDGYRTKCEFTISAGPDGKVCVYVCMCVSCVCARICLYPSISCLCPSISCLCLSSPPPIYCFNPIASHASASPLPPSHVLSMPKTSTVGFRLGSYATGSITVVEPTLCKNVPEQAKTVAAHMQDFIRSSPYSHYCLVTHKGCWRQLLVRVAASGQCLAVLYATDAALPEGALAAECARLRSFAEERRVPVDVLLLQVDNSASCMDKQRPPPIPIKGNQQYIEEKLLGLSFQVSPDAFFQVNTPGAEVLYSLIGDWCQLKVSKHIQHQEHIVGLHLLE